MKNHAGRLHACKASVKKSLECIQICQKCSSQCEGVNDGINSNACEACVVASKESLTALRACVESCKRHSSSCTDQTCIKYMQIFLQKCSALIAAKEECSHYCNTDNMQCVDAYHRSLKACKEFIEAYNACFDNACDGCCERC